MFKSAARSLDYGYFLDAGSHPSSLRGEGERMRWTGAYARFVHPLIYTAAANIKGGLYLFFHFYAVMSSECGKARPASVSCCF